MLCTEVSTGIEELHDEFSVVPFSHSVVATDLAVIKEQLVAELPVSLMCKESISDYYGTVQKYSLISQSSFLIDSSRSF